MPSKSKSQQRFFGMVDAYKKGELKNASSKIKKAAKGMSMSDVKDFAETKHKGLPEKVEEQTIIRLTESDLHRIVKESVNRVLKEAVNIIIENEWQWPEHGVSDDELNLYKKIAYNYALKTFPNEMPYKCLALLFKKTYRDYLIKSNTNVKLYGTIDDYLKKEFEQLDKYGWGQFERFSLPQGWWRYIAWLSKQEGITEGKSGIKIKPENKGKFTATKKATGKSTEELTHSKNPLTKKRAIFAQNARHWNHKK